MVGRGGSLTAAVRSRDGAVGCPWRACGTRDDAAVGSAARRRIRDAPRSQRSRGSAARRPRSRSRSPRCADRARGVPARAADTWPPAGALPRGPGPIEILAADVAIVIDRSTSTRDPTGIDSTATASSASSGAASTPTAATRCWPPSSPRSQRLVDGGAARRHAVCDRLLLGPRRFPARGLRDAARGPPGRAARGGAHRRLGGARGRAWRASASRGSDGASSFAPAMRLARAELCARAATRTSPRAGGACCSSPTVRRRCATRRCSGSRTTIRAWRSRRAARSSPASRSIRSGSARRRTTDSPHALAQIAGATGGTYRAVPDPRNLYCQMLAALGASDPR